MPDPRSFAGADDSYSRKLLPKQASEIARGEMNRKPLPELDRTGGTLGEHVDWKIAYVEQEIRQHKEYAAEREIELKKLWATKEKLRKLGLHDVTASHLPNIPL